MRVCAAKMQTCAYKGSLSLVTDRTVLRAHPELVVQVGHVRARVPRGSCLAALCRFPTTASRPPHRSLPTHLPFSRTPHALARHILTMKVKHNVIPKAWAWRKGNITFRNAEIEAVLWLVMCPIRPRLHGFVCSVALSKPNNCTNLQLIRLHAHVDVRMYFMRNLCM